MFSDITLKNERVRMIFANELGSVCVDFARRYHIHTGRRHAQISDSATGKQGDRPFHIYI
jgi:hypothetical protein